MSENGLRRIATKPALKSTDSRKLLDMKKILDQNNIRRFEELIDGSSKIVLTCHVHPDGDALGSTLGLCHVLRKIGKEASVVMPDQPPKALRFVPGSGEIAVYTKHDPYCQRLISECDLIICCDFNAFSRLDHLAPLIEESKVDKVLIDHHQDPCIDSKVCFSYPGMSSTCELVFRIIADMGLYDEMDSASATCLLTGLITDTQNFTVNCHGTEIYEILIRLMEKGADKDTIINQAVKACSYDSLRIKAFGVSERMKIYPEHRAVIISLSKEDLERFHYEKGDTEGLVNEPLRIGGIVYSIFLREDAEEIKISARSKGQFPVSKICSDLFGGGGHIQASGAEFKGSLSECKAIIEEHMADYDEFLPRKMEKIDWSGAQ